MLGEEAKKGNGWKEEKEMQIWGALFYLRQRMIQSRNRIFFFVFLFVYYFLNKVGLRQP